MNYKPDWTEANAAWERPVISRDGSLIVFSSRATDLAENVTSGTDAIYAASHFEVMPQTLTLSGHGGRVTTYITAQAYTPWQATLEQNGWISYDSLPWGVGSGSMAFLASGANPDARAANRDRRYQWTNRCHHAGPWPDPLWPLARFAGR